jgi:uncharacterized membrane protein
MVPDFLLPEWVPNAHPLIVHFPIALLFLAAAADALALWLGARWRTGREVATGLYVLTGLSAVVTYVSGTWAVDTVTVSTSAAAQTLSTHASWAWTTMVVTAAYGVVRGAALFVEAARARRLVHAAFFVVGLGTFFPLWKVGENGGQMVYQHGVGVTRTQSPPADTSAAPRPVRTSAEARESRPEPAGDQ